MYIVTRTFRDANGVFTVGSIVDPTDVKTFKSRLHQRHIVDVNEANVEHWDAYFKNRYGMDFSGKFAELMSPKPETEAPEVVELKTEEQLATEEVDQPKESEQVTEEQPATEEVAQSEESIQITEEVAQPKESEQATEESALPEQGAEGTADTGSEMATW